MSKYVDKVLNDVKAKNANESEFIQAVDEVLTTLDPVLKAICRILTPSPQMPLPRYTGRCCWDW